MASHPGRDDGIEAAGDLGLEVEPARDRNQVRIEIVGSQIRPPTRVCWVRAGTEPMRGAVVLRGAGVGGRGDEAGGKVPRGEGVLHHRGVGDEGPPLLGVHRLVADAEQDAPVRGADRTQAATVLEVSRRLDERGDIGHLHGARGGSLRQDDVTGAMELVGAPVAPVTGRVPQVPRRVHLVVAVVVGPVHLAAGGGPGLGRGPVRAQVPEIHGGVEQHPAGERQRLGLARAAMPGSTTSEVIPRPIRSGREDFMEGGIRIQWTRPAHHGTRRAGKNPGAPASLPTGRTAGSSRDFSRRTPRAARRGGEVVRGGGTRPA